MHTDYISLLVDQLYKLAADKENPSLVEQFIQQLTSEQAALVALAATQRRREFEKQAEAALEPLKAITAAMEVRFLSEMNASGETNRSGAGWRATKTVRFDASMPDAGAFYAFLAESGRYDMLQRRLSSTVVKEWTDEHGAPPPGVSVHPTNRVTFYRK